MKIRGTISTNPNVLGYPWESCPPSYALEFSSDNNIFYPLFQESNSKRINSTNIETEYFFEAKGYFRYFRLRELSLVFNQDGHGQYISWLDFYVNSNICSACNKLCLQFSFFYLLTSSTIFTFE